MNNYVLFQPIKRITTITLLIWLIVLIFNSCGSSKTKSAIRPDRTTNISISGAKLEIPSGAVDGRIIITAEVIGKGKPEMRRGVKIQGRIYHFSGFEGKTFNKPVKITLPFRKKRSDKSESYPAYWNDNNWVRVDGKIHRSSFIIETDHLSYWAVITIVNDAKELSQTFDEIINYYVASNNRDIRYVLPVAKYRVNSDGMEGVIFGSKIIGFFSGATHSSIFRSFQKHYDIEDAIIEIIEKRSSRPIKYLTLCCPLDVPNKGVVEASDFLLIAEKSNELPLGIPVEVKLNSQNNNSNLPIFRTFSSFKEVYAKTKRYHFYSVGKAGHKMRPGVPWRSNIQTIGLVNGYVFHDNKTFCIMREYQPIKAGIDLGTIMNFVPIDMTGQHTFPEIGSVIFVNGKTERVSGGTIKQYDMPETIYNLTKCANYLDPHNIEIIYGNNVKTVPYNTSLLLQDQSKDFSAVILKFPEPNPYMGNIQKDLGKYFSAIQRGNWKDAMDYVFPKVFNYVPKKLLIEFFMIIEDAGLKIRPESWYIFDYKKPIRKGNYIYTLVANQVMFEIKIPIDAIEYVDEILNEYISEFGELNVRYERAERKFIIRSKSPIYAISRDDGKNWTFCEDTEYVGTFNIIPKDVLRKLNN